VKRKRQWQLLTGVSIILIALAVLIYDTTKSNATRYLEVEEVARSLPELEGKPLRVRGRVQPGSIQRLDDGLQVHFTLTDRKGTVHYPVTYSGLTPDTFKDGSEVVVDGHFTAGRVFQAVQIQAKCPSKYEMQERAASGKMPDDHQATTSSPP